MIKQINEYMSYIPSCDRPISSDVGIIYAKDRTYLFDVGSTYECLDFLYSIQGKKQAVISHFHGDHTWWLTKHKKGDAGLEPGDERSLNYERPEFEKIYIGKGTEKYIPDGMIVTEAVTVTDETKDGKSLKLEIIPMPSSHSKGSLALMVNDEFLFMGDSTYCRYIEPKGDIEPHAEYNVQKLKEQIDLLKSLKADKCLISHEERFIRPKKVVIRQLESVFERRKPGENTIIL